jgi:hypothetical protein
VVVDSTSSEKSVDGSPVSQTTASGAAATSGWRFISVAATASATSTQLAAVIPFDPVSVEQAC